MLSEAQRNKVFPLVSKAPPPIRPPKNCGSYPFVPTLLSRAPPPYETPKHDYYLAAKEEDALRKMIHPDGLGPFGRIETAAMKTYPNLSKRDAVLLYMEPQRRPVQETTGIPVEDKIWKPGKGWRRYGSLRELADVLGQTAPNITYHLKQNDNLYTQNIHHYEKGWYLLSANQNKIKESLKKQ